MEGRGAAALWKRLAEESPRHQRPEMGQRETRSLSPHPLDAPNPGLALLLKSLQQRASSCIIKKAPRTPKASTSSFH